MQDLIDRTDSGYSPALECHNPSGHARRLSRVVGYDNASKMGVSDDVADKRFDPGFGLIIQGGGGFVQQKYDGRIGKSASQRDSLCFAAR
jgi:hypothetical protein